jgi:hypothetical protein
MAEVTAELIRLVMDQTGCERQAAVYALTKTENDLVDAIFFLQQGYMPQRTLRPGDDIAEYEWVVSDGKKIAALIRATVDESLIQRADEMDRYLDRMRDFSKNSQ